MDGTQMNDNPQPATPPHMIATSKKWRTIIVAVILIIVIVFLAVILSSNQKRHELVTSPQPTVIPQVSPMIKSEPTISTADWTTITSKKINITFKYPDTLLPYASTPVSPDNSSYGFDAFSSEEKRDHRALLETDVELEVQVYKPVKTNLDTYLSALSVRDNTIISQPFPGVTGLYRKEKTISHGKTQTAILYSEPENEYSEYDAIVVNNNKNVAIIRLMTGSHTRRQELLPVLEQIALTFTFAK